MKVSYLVMLSALLGVAWGAGTTWFNFGDSPPLAVPTPATTREPSSTAGQPKVLVDERFHNFGPVERESTVRHGFRFMNIGTGVLTLHAAGTTCSRCTIASLPKPELAPGESMEVVVEYEASYLKPQFQQMATILTNDPEQRRVELSIAGTVTTKYNVIPNAVVLSKISANGTSSGEFKIHGYLCDEVRLVQHEFTDAETASYFDARSEPIPPDQLTEPNAKSGCRVVVTVKPGLPLGPIRQTIRLTLSMPPSTENTVIDVPIEGTVDADISLIGRNWNADQAKLTIGSVKSSQGATRQLFLMLRGDHRHDVTIKPEAADPAWLRVTLGEPSDIKSGTGSEGVTQIPLTIEIPPGVPPANHRGSAQGKYGEILLETNHPQAKQIRIYLDFIVEL